MASISSALTDSSFDDSTITTASDTHSATSSSPFNRRVQVQQTLKARRNRIETWLGAWEAVSFPCLYSSELVVALESGSSFTERCKSWNPGRPLDENAPWLLSTVVIPIDVLSWGILREENKYHSVNERMEKSTIAAQMRHPHVDMPVF
jgi:hypothetical protein